MILILPIIHILPAALYPQPRHPLAQAALPEKGGLKTFKLTVNKITGLMNQADGDIGSRSSGRSGSFPLFMYQEYKCLFLFSTPKAPFQTGMIGLFSLIQNGGC